jgi:uncharacterized protein (TIGR02646 family)
MIKVSKSATVPASLLVDNCTSYRGQDVEISLVNDQHEKCYLCEQKTNNLFEIEHFKAQAVHQHLKYEWTNLFLSCPYCNSRKPNDFDLLDPIDNSIEDILAQRINLSARTAEITSLRPGLQETFTVSLLERIFNGKNRLREFKGELLFRKIEGEIIFFLSLLLNYKIENTPENKQKIIDSLLITKEFLAFKYWIIKDNATLYDEFKYYMVWNKIS